VNICVLIKPIIDPTSTQWDYKNNHFEFITNGFNQADVHALQWACDYKHKYAGHITVLMVIDAMQEIKLQNLLKYNIDECLIIKQENLHLFRNEVAFLLVKELKNRVYDLLLSGSEGEDTHLGITPIAVAELLNIPSLTNVHHIEPVQDRIWQVQRKEGRGVVQTFQIELPALIGVVSSIGRKRYISRYTTLSKAKEVSITVVEGQLHKNPDVNVLRVTEPQPNIRIFNVPSPALSAEKRLLEIMGLSQKGREGNTEKIHKEVSSKNIHFLKEKLQQWLKED
jgi:electron transfer flavoprotein alpha/beta subunit